jgi:hypothetical protein
MLCYESTYFGDYQPKFVSFTTLPAKLTIIASL